MIEWVEETTRRRLPGLPDSKAPVVGTVEVVPLTTVSVSADRAAMVDWVSGGWVLVDRPAQAAVGELHGRDARDVDPDFLDVLWGRGLVRVGGQEPFSAQRFEADLATSREYYTLVYLLSPGCNLVCSYCYLGHETPRRSQQFGVDHAMALFEESLALDYPGVLVDFGEFSVATDLFRELLARFRRRGRQARVPVWFSAQTNGTTLDEDLCREIVGDDLLLSISIDGPAELHDAARTFRNGSGSHDSACRAVAKAKQAGIRTNLIATIGRHNIGHPYAVVEELLHRGPDRYLLKPVLAQGEADRAWASVGVHPTEYAAFTGEAFEAGLRYGLPGLDQTALKFLLRLCGSPTGWRDACTSRWCGSGRDLHVVAADGAVHACPRFVEGSGSATPVTLGRVPSPVLDRDLLDEKLRQPHASCEGCAWYRTCGGGCTLAGGLQGRDANCDSFLVLFDRLVRLAIPLLVDGAGVASRMGLAVRRLRLREEATR